MHSPCSCPVRNLYIAYLLTGNMHLLLSRLVGYGLIVLGLLFGWLPIIPGILLVLFGVYLIEQPKIDTFTAQVRKLIGYEEPRRVAGKPAAKR